jgi:lysyl-tRNA synthetase class 1
VVEVRHGNALPAGGVDGDWVARIADRVVAAAERRGALDSIVCASGISPSGPIHLGNLREIMVPHLVADEIRRRGLPCRHILSWDDYDRLRKVPAGFPDSFAEHIGRPLSEVPDPCGDHESWSEHFKAPFRDALEQLAVEVEEISQSRQYTTGKYRDQILHAMTHRHAIYDVLAKYRTLGADPGDEDGLADVVAGTLERDRYFPYRPYCRICDRDTTHVRSFDEPTSEITYHCDAGHDDGFPLDAVDHGKLVWKVDWPMRWAYEGVIFEAGGVDHSSPGSSYTVGEELVRTVFGGEPPEYVQYSFVGTDGAAKMSGSAGKVLTPGDALSIIERPLVRWLYCREPRKAITISFNEKVTKVYDDWDRLEQRVRDGRATVNELAVHSRASSTASALLPTTPRVVPFQSLVSLVDITNADPDQLLRIVSEMIDGAPLRSLAEIQPRLDCAETWVAQYMSASQRTEVRSTPDVATLESLEPEQQESIALLLDGLEGHWTLQGLSDLVYGVPKLQLGLPVDSREQSPELKSAQRAFFALLYRLLVGRDTGPRLPTLLLSLGRARVEALLTRPG